MISRKELNSSKVGNFCYIYSSTYTCDTFRCSVKSFSGPFHTSIVPRTLMTQYGRLKLQGEEEEEEERTVATVAPVIVSLPSEFCVGNAPKIICITSGKFNAVVKFYVVM